MKSDSESQKSGLKGTISDTEKNLQVTLEIKKNCTIQSHQAPFYSKNHIILTENDFLYDFIPWAHGIVSLHRKISLYKFCVCL